MEAKLGYKWAKSHFLYMECQFLMCFEKQLGMEKFEDNLFRFHSRILEFFRDGSSRIFLKYFMKSEFQVPIKFDFGQVKLSHFQAKSSPSIYNFKSSQVAKCLS